MSKIINFRNSLKSILDDQNNYYNAIVETTLFIIIALSVVFILFEMLLPVRFVNLLKLETINRGFLYFFIVELAIRIFAHSGKGYLLNYLKSFYFWIDFISILPFLRIFRSVRLLKLLRVLRVVKLGKYKSNIWAIIESLSTFLSMSTLQISLIGGLITAIILSAAITLKKINPDISFSSACWWSALRIIDPGFVEISNHNISESILSLVITLLGIIIFGLFIGLSSNLFMQYFAKVQYRKRNLKISDHYLLCNWGNDSMMKQLIEELHFHNGKAAILAQKEDITILDDFSAGTYHYREGDSTDLKDLKSKGAILSAKNIIIFLDRSNKYNEKNAENRTMLSLMVIKEIFEREEKEKIKRQKKQKPNIDMQTKDASKNIIIESENKDLTDWIKQYSNFDKKLNINLTVIDKSKLLAQILMQSGLNTHLSTIYYELFTHNGQELEVVPAKEIFTILNFEEKEKVTFIKLWKALRNVMVSEKINKINPNGIDKESNKFITQINQLRYFLKNKKMRKIKALMHLKTNNPALLIGIINNKGKLYLNPKTDEIVKPNSKLVFIADISKELEKKGNNKYKHKYKKKKINREPTSLLITAWNKSVDNIIREAITYGIKNIYILAENYQKIEEGNIEFKEDDTNKKENIFIRECDLDKCKHLSKKDGVLVNYFRADPTNSKNLDKILKNNPDIMITVADKTSDGYMENADAKTIKTLFQLKNREKNISIVAEILNVENRKHAHTAGADSVIISPITVGNYITQVTRRKEIKDIFEQLLTISGKEIYTLENRFKRQNFEKIFIDLYTNYRMLLIGTIDKDKNIVLNSPNHTVITEEIKELIVICKRATFNKYENKDYSNRAING
jgi:voltage-gated potassium channel